MVAVMLKQLKQRPPPARRRRGSGRALVLAATAALVALSCLLPFHYSHTAATAALHADQLPGLQGLTAALHRLPSEGSDLLSRFVGADADVVVHRSSFAASMEHALDANATASICEGGRPLLAGTPDHICRPMVCLWSSTLQRNIDLSFHALTDLPWEAHPKRCAEPAGGQAGSASGAAPAISLVLLSGSDPHLAAQGLLELFRTAREADAAELLVVDSTAGGGSRLLERAVARLVHAFGVDLRLLPVPAGAAPWAAAQAGLAAAAAPFAAVVAPGTFVTRGWLHSLLRTMAAHPKAGLVGPLVLASEQVVLQAGGVVHSDAGLSLLGAGARLDADYGYMRQVDFVSSTCFLVRMAAWKAGRGTREADGLSGLYADAGVSLSIAAQGYTTLVQPAAVVFRQPPSEAGAAAQAAAAAAAAAEEDDRKTFQRRWAHLLKPGTCTSRPLLRGMWDRGTTTRVMWVDDVVPMPDNDSGSVRTMSLLKILIQAGYDVTYQPLMVWRRNYALPLQMMGIRVLPLLRPDRWQVTNSTGACAYDGFVVARRTNFAIARQALHDANVCQDVPMVFDTVDLHFMREARQIVTQLRVPGINKAFDLVEWMDLKAPALSESNQNISDLLGWRSQECELIRTADAAFLVSPDEVKVMEHYVPDSAPRLYLVTNIHDDVVPHKTVCQGREGLLFVGNYNHAPNREAVAFLLTGILPAVRKRLPPHLAHLAHAHIVGAGKPNQEMQDLLAAHSDKATFYGYLPDDELRLLYSRVKVVIAPLVTGAGVKGKVNQAMKLGVPVVGTRVALEGMHAQDGVNCLVADDAEGLAGHVAQLCEDCVMWERLVAGGYANMQQHFSIEAARPAVLEAFKKVGLGLPECGASARRRR